MCGITGLFDSFSNVNIISAMSNLIKHRGPDQFGEFISPNRTLALAHQRLSILDLTERGRQPMVSSDGCWVIVFNGEIYNYRELAGLLKSETDFSFSGTSDTEVLLECISHWGVNKTLPLLNGMFAFAVYNIVDNTVVLARDRFGEKPLYLYSDNHSFAFSSELRPIEYLDKTLTLNASAIDAQLRYSYIPSPYTIYNEVFKLPPGHSIMVKLDEFNGISHNHAQPYWFIEDIVDNGLTNRTNYLNVEDSILAVEQALTKSVTQRMVSDVPLGAFLSGGIDSSCITAIAQANAPEKVKTFSIGFNDDNYNEAHHAKKVAGILGTEHHELYLEPNDMLDFVPKLADVYDEPFSDSSQLPTLMVSKFAKDHVTVALTGDSGDELFCGYNRYIHGVKVFNRLSSLPSPARHSLSNLLSTPSPNMYNYIFNMLGNLSSRLKKYKRIGDNIHKLSYVIGFKDDIDLYNRLITTWPHTAVTCEVHDIATEIKSVFNKQELTLAEKMMWQDTIGYMQNDILTKVDRAAMAVSLEARVPFLDNDVFQLSWSIPLEHKTFNNMSKYPLRKIISKYVPDDIMNRPKAGFGVPVDSWLRKELRPWAESLLSRKSLEVSGLLDVEQITNAWNAHLSGSQNLRVPIWNVLMFQQWLLSRR
ncbi:asparagine synthase (glutamine-hydrolyzing) [Vibrio lentus]|uniref:asparagine synthase (glutamine-hydrolyzing) n=1 Tax=Vibrio lentus TaxID=136468 RepID=UPI000C844D19|nr:asparagine synthase (glutamine-hydrolyzing) [Vibrio lentus]PMM56247.1 asparagine synthase (glutamine-hydrolyzing) [Vibrio lentus]